QGIMAGRTQRRKRARVQRSPQIPARAGYTSVTFPPLSTRTLTVRPALLALPLQLPAWSRVRPETFEKPAARIADLACASLTIRGRMPVPPLCTLAIGGALRSGFWGRQFIMGSSIAYRCRVRQARGFRKPKFRHRAGDLWLPKGEPTEFSVNH